METTEKFYIWNTKTDQNFDYIDNKFYGANWEPETTDDKKYLEIILKSDKKKFKDCAIVQKFY